MQKTDAEAASRQTDKQTREAAGGRKKRGGNTDMRVAIHTGGRHYRQDGGNTDRRTEIQTGGRKYRQEGAVQTEGGNTDRRAAVQT